MKIILDLQPYTTAKCASQFFCLSLLSQPNLSLLTRRWVAGPVWEWYPSLSWWRGARAASPSGTWTSATCCRRSTWARAATAKASGSCWCSIMPPSSATSAASSAWCTCPRCWRNWTEERRMDGRCSWCRWGKKHAPRTSFSSSSFWLTVFLLSFVASDSQRRHDH